MDDALKEFPIIPHEAAGVECWGCIVVTVRENDAELACDACGAVVGVVNTGVLRDLVGLIRPEPKDA